MEKGEIRINTENIFPIIKKAVYSDHEIFLRELVSNAVDAISKRRMASMAGDCENCDEPQVKITIDREKNILKISDNGIGMTPAVRRKIFEQFYREQSGNIHNVKGHGLGLSYVKRIIELHNGTINVESKINKGSTFTVKLPIKSFK